MIFVAAVLLLLAVAVGWLIFRAHTDRSYVNGKYRRRPPEPDGHIEAEEAEIAAQMRVRLEYYRHAKENPPVVKRVGETILASDDFEAAAPIFAEWEKLPARPLAALCVVKDWDYRAVWFLDGLSDIAKAAIYEESSGETVFMPEYGILVARAGDVEGFRRIYAGLNI